MRWLIQWSNAGDHEVNGSNDLFPKLIEVVDLLPKPVPVDAGKLLRHGDVEVAIELQVGVEPRDLHVLCQGSRAEGHDYGGVEFTEQVALDIQ